MTSVSAVHILLTPTQTVGSGRPQWKTNQESLSECRTYNSIKYPTVVTRNLLLEDKEINSLQKIVVTVALASKIAQVAKYMRVVVLVSEVTKIHASSGISLRSHQNT